MRRLLAAVLVCAAVTAEAGRFRAPVIRPVFAPAPLGAMAAPLLAPSPSLALNAASPTVDPVSASELTGAQIEKIERYSARGVEQAREFLDSPPPARGGYLLGISGNGRHEAIAEVTGLTPFGETYVELFGRAHPVRTPEFLDFITRSGEEAVFLVPPKALTHEKAGVTKEELEWLFTHPERMKAVRFVFGAYDIPAPPPVFPVSADSYRVAQRRRHDAARGTEYPFVEGDPARMVAEFEDEIGRAAMVRERSSRGLVYFATPAGTFLVRRILRGYFLEVFPEGEGVRREAFVSKRGAPALFARIEGMY